MMDHKKLNDVAEDLFKKKKPLDSLHQEIADNFYPERATFTLDRSLGNDFASNLMTSYPILCRRDLGNQLGTMLRPIAEDWFHVARRHVEEEDNETKQWLEKFEETQRRAMYDPDAMFSRATKEGDHDFAAFGQCVISTELANNPLSGQHLLYRCWHLKDMAWQENEYGRIGSIFRNWKPTVQQLLRTFGQDKVDAKVIEMKDKTPFAEVNVRHMVIEADMYDDSSGRHPFWSIWYDIDHDKLMEASPVWTSIYTIPRWQTVSGSQYAYSPATVAALPDARLVQAMTYTLLEAGEKATNPPMIATIDAVKSDIALYAGGVTWADKEYDERLGEALRPIGQDLRGINFGIQMNANAQAMIREAFFLNILTMPQRGPEMTAYEVGQRIQAFIRGAMPIFGPMEMEYNAQLCDQTFELLWRNGAFGSPMDWPKSIQGADIEFRFTSPLHDAIEEQKGHLFLESAQLLAQALAIDPSVVALPKIEVSLRDALTGIGAPATWLNSEADVEKAKKDAQAQAKATAMLQALKLGSESVKNVGGIQPAMPT